MMKQAAGPPMSAQGHSPTPWAIHGDDGTLIGANDDKMMLAHMTYRHMTHPEWDRGLVQGQANARHIVRCVNAHDGLVAALRDACAVLDAFLNTDTLATDECDAALTQARRALAALESGENGKG